ncbi:MAG: LacI family DNA-binding transcriptional regulator, partial [Anaerolineae bacterium]|nr:LacI family DNA-binding transcriptional regulator [Anaerolineae bacterium]
IARKAGVSRSTVSRVINDSPNVSEQTRQRVLAIIEQENFHPNAAARALVKRRTDILGVVIPTSSNVFLSDNNYYPLILAGLNDAIRQLDYAMLMWLGEVTQDDQHLMRKLSNPHLTDGLIFVSLPSDHPLYAKLGRLRQPFVMIDRPFTDVESTNYVSVDNVRAAEIATEHLIRLGRRRIAHITGDMTITDAYDRLTGYKNALRAAGLPVDDSLIIESTFNRETGYYAMQRLLPHKPDALFAASDTVAAGALQAVLEAGLRVPDDLSIVGFDDVDVATQVTPPLTTVRQPIRAKGEAAARLLVDLVNHRVSAPQHVILPTELVIRRSCGATATTSREVMSAQ